MVAGHSVLHLVHEVVHPEKLRMCQEKKYIYIYIYINDEESNFNCSFYQRKGQLQV